MKYKRKFTKGQYQEMDRVMNMTDKTTFVFTYEIDTYEGGKWGIMIWKIHLN